jgi:hypothetical protein
MILIFLLITLVAITNGYQCPSSPAKQHAGTLKLLTKLPKSLLIHNSNLLTFPFVN